MKESVINKRILRVMFGVLFIGGAAAILGIYRATKNTGRPLGDGMGKHDRDIFVCGAHA